VFDIYSFKCFLVLIFAPMETLRQQKVSRLIQKELAGIFFKVTPGFIPGKMVTVTQVRISPDLLEVKAYLSVFPSKDADEVLKMIRTKTPEIRLSLGNILKKNLRRIPNLSFFIDDSLDYAERIDELLK
jgi:ribosome-binding factor A